MKVDLRRKRESNGLKLREVSRGTGIPICSLSNIERGMEPTLENAVLLEQFYNLPDRKSVV